jgi:hypothetical protein
MTRLELEGSGMHRRRSIVSLVALALIVFGAGCGGAETSSTAQQTFATPEAAAEAVLDAIERDDLDAIRAIFGREYEPQIVTPDWDADREERQRIAAAGRQKLGVEYTDDRAEFAFGEESWPFPIPLLRTEEGWQFDTAVGIEEVIDRRIGRNELATIELARAYVDAQIEFARDDHDGDDVLEYAQRAVSSEGTHDGLYWESAPGEPESPFGPLVRGAERYLATREKGDPIRGYYFRILTSQGEHPPGGAYDYVINGNMIAGFALAAWPADYGSSGVMTLVVSHRGKVYQKDLGPNSDVTVYDPDDTWTEVPE